MINISGIDIEFPEQPVRHKIQNFDKPTRDQKWERTPLPTFTGRDIDIWDDSEIAPDDQVTWEEAVRQETIKITGCDPDDLDRQANPRPVAGVQADPNYYMDCLENHRIQEFERIHNGHWIFINGKAYWLPGAYYFYLNYWWVGDAVPEFRYPDLELMWLWDHVDKSPTWLGVIYITMRSTGKSYLGGAINYHKAITKREARTGIQSKTGEAAGSFFREKILIPVSKLPEFLRGINRDMFLGDTTGSSNISFSPPAKKKIPNKVYNMMKKKALYSWMDFLSTIWSAYDGQSLSFYFGDEIGKWVEENIFKTWGTIFNCLWRGNKKRGSALLTTTVEKMELGGENCFKVWNASDMSTYLHGRTQSGMVQYFRGALDATFFDEFGFPDRQQAKEYHDGERQKRQHDQADLVKYKQQNPYTVEEAFWVTSSTCIYNQEILLTSRDRIIYTKNQVRTGRIEWVPGKIDKEARFVDDDAGFWNITFTNFEYNQVRTNEGHKKTFTPLANHKRIMGIDPYASEDLADEDAGSDGAAAVYNKHDINIPEEFCDTFIADYLGRPKDPFVFYEDMIVAAFWFGCAMFIETNKSNMRDYLKTRGYRWGYEGNELDFMWERPESTLTKYSVKQAEGMWNGKGTITHYTNSTAQHIEDHGHKLKHVRIIDDWIKFDPKKTKKFDMGVAASMAVVANERPATEVGKKIELATIFQTYDNKGDYSRQN